MFVFLSNPATPEFYLIVNSLTTYIKQGVALVTFGQWLLLFMQILKLTNRLIRI